MKVVSSFEKKNYKLILGLILVILAVPVAVLLANRDVVSYLTRATVSDGPAFLALILDDQTEFSRLPVQVLASPGDEVDLVLALDTGDVAVDGAKVAIRYDNKKLRLLGNTVEGGTVFSKFLARDIDNLEGLVRLEFAGSYTGVGKVAYLGFEVLPGVAGQAVVEVVSDPQYLDDSKVYGVESQVDILGGANQVIFVLPGGEVSN